MSQPIRGQGGHLVFPIGPKNTNLVEDVEIYLPVKFRQIPFSGFSGECENVKLTTTDDGRRTTHDHNSALELFLGFTVLYTYNFDRWFRVQIFKGDVSCPCHPQGKLRQQTVCRSHLQNYIETLQEAHDRVN